jgi:hypothetical protein
MVFLQRRSTNEFTKTENENAHGSKTVSNDNVESLWRRVNKIVMYVVSKGVTVPRCLAMLWASSRDGKHLGFFT